MLRWGARMSDSCCFRLRLRQSPSAERSNDLVVRVRRGQRRPNHLAPLFVSSIDPKVQAQVGRPRGSGMVQLFVVASCVITSFAVAEPS